MGVDMAINLPSGSCVTLSLWDTAGQDSYRNITRLYLRDALVAFLCHSPDQREKSTSESEDSQEPGFQMDAAKQYWSSSVVGWMKVMHEVNENCQFVLVTTKIDLLGEDNAKKAEWENHGGTLMDQFNCVGYYSTSAITGEGLADLIVHGAELALEARNSKEKGKEKPVIQLENENGGESSCC
jgi:GTPase SAR1 family protein